MTAGNPQRLFLGIASLLLSQPLAIGQGVMSQGGKPQALAGGGRTVQSSPLSPVPDIIIWRAFFRRVTFLEDVARKAEARGRSGAAQRDEIQRKAGLTSREMEVLSTEAADCQKKLDEISSSASLLQRSVRAVVASGGTPSPADVQALRDLQTQSEQNITDHVGKIKSLFGDIGFRRLEGYVHSTSTVKAMSSPIPGAVPQKKENVR
jgi:hypothetical protein